MSALAAVDTKEMDALAWVSMKDAVIEIRIKKDLRITRKGVSLYFYSKYSNSKSNLKPLKWFKKRLFYHCRTPK